MTLDISQLHAEWAATDNGESPSETDTINSIEHVKVSGKEALVHDVCQPVQHCKGYMRNNTCCTYAATENGLCKMHGKKRYAECNICFDNMYVRQRLACSHEFCRNCIYKWAGEDKECPVCRAPMVFTNYSKESYIAKVKQMVYCIDQYVQDIKWKDASHWLCAIEDEIYECVELLVTNDWMMNCTRDYKGVLSTYIDYGNKINEKRFRKFSKIWNCLKLKKVFIN